MKYMGSKRILLQNGLGEILEAEATSATRVVDLFCGGASVSWFAATELKKPVLACDLQQYAVVLASSVVERTQPLQYDEIKELWLDRVNRTRNRLKGWRSAAELDTAQLQTKVWSKSARDLCESNLIAKSSLISRFYGGHYFSPTQALTFDAMLRALPQKSDLRKICLAATIIAASQCAAAPGHTAQPLKATRTGAKHLRSCWLLDPMNYAKKAVEQLVSLHASLPGNAVVEDANEIAKNLNSNDVVFIDPPYSAVQYSRFYHVLETIARGTCNEVEGVGRYPPYKDRPNSRYSRKNSSLLAIDDLLQNLAINGCTVILTYPKSLCSNGLSGDKIEEIACKFFSVKRRTEKSNFSTLGGNTVNRAARRAMDELILVLRSKS